ncbi:MAG: hypothetical protein CSA68_05490 [Rhodobacterales bacterium]|nr:MAG: hypothetical protein CSA68_05490 [Rhodobacterales bacterium]
MSGIFTPFLIGLGLASALFALLVASKMAKKDGVRTELELAPIAFTKYILWLLVEIARANWAVTKLVLARDMKIRQHMFIVPISQRTDLGQVIFANSITLTPGTITVDVNGRDFMVHAVSYNDDDPEALADMDARVTVCETPGPASGEN